MKIAIERQAAQLNSGAVLSIDFSLWVQKHQPSVGFEPRPNESDSVTSMEVLTNRLSVTCHRVSNNWFCHRVSNNWYGKQTISE